MTTKQFPLRFPLQLYRQVRAAAGIACTPMSQWIFDACDAKLKAMPVQIPYRLTARNPAARREKILDHLPAFLDAAEAPAPPDPPPTIKPWF